MTRLIIMIALLLLRRDLYISTASATFKVAVYDQGEQLKASTSNDIIERMQALEILTTQLEVYEKNAIYAKSQGVVMIVFPEYGLMPSRLSHQKAFNFTENIADLDPRNLSYNPCLTTDTVGIEVQHKLSCMAMENSMYVTANIGERDRFCTRRRRCNQYNTNVVFSPQGLLVARYRKYNLFMGEPSYDQPSSVDYAYFDTPYGRFGAAVCFDIIFDEPVVRLIENFTIDHLLFPTAWMNQLPYYSAVTFHQAFAIGLGVNLLGANLHRPESRMCGSGIYGANVTYSCICDTLSSNSTLLIGEIPIVPNRIPSRFPASGRQLSIGETSFELESELFGDVFRMVILRDLSGTAAVCHNSLCCTLNFTRELSEETFALGSFRGLHTLEGQYYLEMCVLLKCQATQLSECDGKATTSNTRFPYMALTGNFTTKYVYPMVVSDGIDPSSGDWHYTGDTIVSYGTRKPLVSSTMYGRRFDLDQAS